jgi:hexosaminidase
MRRSFLIAGMLLLLGTFFTTAQVANYNVIPMPLSIEQGNEKAFVLTKNTKILYPKNNEKMKRNAAFLTDYLKENTGILLKSKAAKSGGNAILLKTGLVSKNSEAYEIEVSPKGIVITGASEAGVFYGIQTLRKSIPVAQTKKVKMPAVKISDAPAFAYRGMMLDVSRHFCTVDSVKRWIDMLALHNVNTFHWHLTEDQGWRIEIKKYPRLTEIGSKRTETVIGRNTGKYDGKPHGGFYTQAEARRNCSLCCRKIYQCYS